MIMYYGPMHINPCKKFFADWGAGPIDRPDGGMTDRIAPPSLDPPEWKFITSVGFKKTSVLPLISDG